MKRVFDFFFSLTGLIILFPLFVIISWWIILDSKGGIFYKQIRVGKNNLDFKLFKFRTMQVDSDKKGLLTVGAKDSRITFIGYFLRKYKLDELPQLLNVLNGSMSFVGPRPEVRKYVAMYNASQKEILIVKPGLTDYASLEYFNENEILGKSKNPEKDYIDIIMPEKINLNKKYIIEQNLLVDLKIILRTIAKIFYR